MAGVRIRSGAVGYIVLLVFYPLPTPELRRYAKTVIMAITGWLSHRLEQAPRRPKAFILTDRKDSLSAGSARGITAASVYRLMQTTLSLRIGARPAPAARLFTSWGPTTRSYAESDDALPFTKSSNIITQFVPDSSAPSSCAGTRTFGYMQGPSALPEAGVVGNVDQRIRDAPWQGDLARAAAILGSFGGLRYVSELRAVHRHPQVRPSCGAAGVASGAEAQQSTSRGVARLAPSGGGAAVAQRSSVTRSGEPPSQSASMHPMRMISGAPIRWEHGKVECVSVFVCVSVFMPSHVCVSRVCICVLMKVSSGVGTMSMYAPLLS